LIEGRLWSHAKNAKGAKFFILPRNRSADLLLGPLKHNVASRAKRLGVRQCSGAFSIVNDSERIRKRQQRAQSKTWR
jgi:hypothetical protein